MTEKIATRIMKYRGVDYGGSPAIDTARELSVPDGASQNHPGRAGLVSAFFERLGGIDVRRASTIRLEADDAPDLSFRASSR